MVSIKDFQNLDFRVAEILEVNPHPNADRLYVLKIRVGEVEKQIVAGIRLHYQPEQLVGKKVVVVNNLEPAVIRGVESNGMLLAASNDTMLTLIIPERDVPSGAQVR
ncbi:MAG: methionine--tRNA ligase subunit beta [Candidatus Omnitrophica bacterium]|nr:methionine--tRNA ligase subunit beta [Candidatus Omnitrophota bacterium]